MTVNDNINMSLELTGQLYVLYVCTMCMYVRDECVRCVYSNYEKIKSSIYHKMSKFKRKNNSPVEVTVSRQVP